LSKIGIFFGTESGTTRLIAKRIAKALTRRLGEGVVAKPLNVNRIEPEDLGAFEALILGTPTYGDGVLPGQPNGTKESSWAEFLPRLAGQDLSGIRVALYGLGDQETYPKHFLDAMSDLHACFAGLGAEMLGSWPVEGYAFERSRAVRDGRFLGLALDQHLQHLLTDQRIEAWLDDLAPRLLPGLKVAAADPALSTSHP
jgi:flavodoxin I